MNTLTDTRIWWGWPMKPPTLPAITAGMSRGSGGEYYGIPWDALVSIRIHGEDAAQIDSVEELIVDYLRDNSETILGTLSDTNVSCKHLGYPENVGAFSDDIPTLNADGTRYVFLTRTIQLESTFVRTPD